MISSIDGSMIDMMRCAFMLLRVMSAAVEIQAFVSSLRLDAVIAAGFRMARSKAAGLVSAGRVQADYREAMDPDRILKRDAVVSVRGYGKIRLSQIGDRTKKGRIPIVIWKYV